MFERVYELPISMDYVRHWGMLEAVREIIQNALDSESPFEWEIDKEKLIIRSKFARLEPSSLLLGTTSKADSKDAIGSFGEGYKIALLVLTRLNYEVTVYNNESVWKPEFRDSKKFNASTLCVISNNSSDNRKGVTFEIDGMSENDIREIKESCLHMQKDIGQVKHTNKGLILLDKPNMLYVGGLFICKTALDYGYDIKPEYIKLERDRQTVSNFDLKLVTKDMWFDVEDQTMIVELMEKNCPDLEYAEYGTPEIIKEACYRHFKKKHPNSVIVNSQKEMEDLVKSGMERVIISRSSSYISAITSSSGYSESGETVKKSLSIAYDLERWLENNKKHMRRSAIMNFKALIDKSVNWKRG